MTDGASIDAGPDGSLRVELPPSRLMMRVGLVFEVAFTGMAALTLFAPGDDAPWPVVALAWAAAFTVAELLRFGRLELTWSPRARRLRRRFLMKHGVLPFSERQWRPGADAQVRVVEGRGEHEAGFWFVCLEEAGRPSARLFWTPEKRASENIAARLAEAIAAPR
jgi:hypothetical protein